MHKILNKIKETRERERAREAAALGTHERL